MPLTVERVKSLYREFEALCKQRLHHRLSKEEFIIKTKELVPPDTFTEEELKLIGDVFKEASDWAYFEYSYPGHKGSIINDCLGT